MPTEIQKPLIYSMRFCYGQLSETQLANEIVYLIYKYILNLVL